MGKGKRTRNLADAVRRAGSDRGVQRVGVQMPGMSKPIDPDLPVPDRLPEPGDKVVFLWGDPNLINSEVIAMLFWVTDIDVSGRLCGYANPSPLVRAQGPRGEPVAMPPMFPVVSVPYDPTCRGKLTWHWPLDGHKALQEVAAVIDVESVESVEKAAPAFGLVEGGLSEPAAPVEDDI